MSRLNYRHIILGESTEHETVGVKRKDGTSAYLPWLGFLALDQARNQGKSVKLEVVRVTKSDGFGEWQLLSHNQYAQGCLVPEGVYGVLCDGRPRVI